MYLSLKRQISRERIVIIQTLTCMTRFYVSNYRIVHLETTPLGAVYIVSAALKIRTYGEIQFVTLRRAHIIR